MLKVPAVREHVGDADDIVPRGARVVETGFNIRQSLCTLPFNGFRDCLRFIVESTFRSSAVFTMSRGLSGMDTLSCLTRKSIRLIPRPVNTQFELQRRRNWK